MQVGWSHYSSRVTWLERHDQHFLMACSTLISSSQSVLPLSTPPQLKRGNNKDTRCIYRTPRTPGRVWCEFWFSSLFIRLCICDIGRKQIPVFLGYSPCRTWCKSPSAPLLPLLNLRSCLRHRTTRQWRWSSRLCPIFMVMAMSVLAVDEVVVITFVTFPMDKKTKDRCLQLERESYFVCVSWRNR